jgi:DNA-binding transcriptional LysR family regulator
VVSCIGESTAEIEDALTDEVAIAFGRHVLRLACAELGRMRDECRAESRPLGKREIAIADRREHDLARIQPNHAIRAVIDEAIRRGRQASRRSFRSTSADTGTSTCRPTTPSWRAAFRRSSSRKRRWPTV